MFIDERLLRYIFEGIAIDEFYKEEDENYLINVKSYLYKDIDVVIKLCTNKDDKSKFEKIRLILIDDSKRSVFREIYSNVFDFENITTILYVTLLAKDHIDKYKKHLNEVKDMKKSFLNYLQSQKQFEKTHKSYEYRSFKELAESNNLIKKRGKYYAVQ